MTPLQAMLRSRKAWVLVLAVGAVVALAALGRIDGQAALDFVKWLVSAWMGSVALEDAARARGSTTATAVTNVALDKPAERP